LRCAVDAVPVEKLLGVDPSSPVGKKAEELGAYSYFEIAEFAEEKKLGVVLGWVRPSDTEPIQVNPSGKNTKVMWHKRDVVIIVRVRVTDVSQLFGGGKKSLV
jgi:hypothetical protein